MFAVACWPLVRDWFSHSPAMFIDFRPWFCAGQVLDGGADPYRAEPLGACERTLVPGQWTVYPAPLPPFELALFGLLGRLAYADAALAWLLVLCVGAVVSVVALSKTCRTDGWTVALALCFSYLYTSLHGGQNVVLAGAGLALAGLLLERERPVAAAFAASLSMLEPHLGLAACLSLFVWVPRSRLALIVAGALCALVPAALLGFDLTREFAGGVLPAHAAAEVHSEQQFSLTQLLAFAGSPDGAAIRLGELSYAAALFVGVLVARRLASRFSSPALLAYVPVAFVVFGGPFVHLWQISTALFAALLLARVAPSHAGIRAAVVLLAVPWAFFPLWSLAPALAVAAALLTWRYFGGPPRRVALAGAAAMLFLVALIHAFSFAPRQPLTRRYDDAAHLASLTFGAAIDAGEHAAQTLPQQFAKLPTYAGLVFVLGGALGLAYPRTQRVAPQDAVAKA